MARWIEMSGQSAEAAKKKQIAGASRWNRRQTRGPKLSGIFTGDQWRQRG